MYAYCYTSLILTQHVFDSITRLNLPTILKVREKNTFLHDSLHMVGIGMVPYFIRQNIRAFSAKIEASVFSKLL